MKNTLEGKTEAMTQTSFSNEDIESACLLQDCQSESERSYEYDSPIATSNTAILIKDTIDEAMALTRVAIKKNLANKSAKVEFEQVSLSFISSLCGFTLCCVEPKVS